MKPLLRVFFAGLVGLLSLPVGAATISISAPTANQIFTAPALITVSATTSGTGIAKVEFYQGTTLIGSDTSSPYSIRWSSVPAGSYSFTAKAKNSAGTVLATSSTIPIVVNAPPTVSITSPTANQGFATGSSIPLTATATDSDGTVSNVAFYRGSTLIGTATASPYTATWSNASPGSYSLTAKATDNRGAVTTSSAVAVKVAAPPTVSLTAPTANQVFTAPANLSLAASATAGSGGTISKVEFYQGTTLVGTATTSPYKVTWSNAPAGSYSLTAKAIDNRGIAKTSAAVPIVVNAPPMVSITTPTAGQVVAAPATVTVTASAADSDGTVSKIDFYQGTTLIGTATTAPYSVTWSNVQPGSYSLTAVATDDRGLATTSAPVSITMVANQPPTVLLTTPTAGQQFTAPASIPLSVNAADSDGSVTRVTYFQNGTPIATVSTPPFSYAWNNVPEGQYTITAQATDSFGAQTTSNPVSVTVASPAPVAGIYYIHPDHLGTPRLITDQQQNPVWRWDNAEPFGNNPPDEDPQGTGVRFEFNKRHSGYYADKETGNWYAYLRDAYRPDGGSFGQSDPIGLAGGSLSTYAFVNGDPLRYTDPLGLFKFHGQWCGPNWTGGFEKPWDRLTPDERQKVKPPEDALDSCCEVHDKCHADCRAKFPCDMDQQKRCLESCDRRLYLCSRQSGVGSFPLEDYMRKSSPTPEKGACCPK